MRKYVICTSEPFRGYVYTCMTDGIHSDYGKETFDEICKRESGRTFKIIDDAELNELLKNYLKEISSDPFSEITEERYNDLYDCLPPARTGFGWFFVGEPFHFDVYLLCFKSGNKYYSGHRRINTPEKDILKEITDFEKKQKELATIL